jgi:hypothetical protein
VRWIATLRPWIVVAVSVIMATAVVVVISKLPPNPFSSTHSALAYDQ